VISSYAHAITLDDIKGYSIEVTGTVSAVFRSDDPSTPRSGKMQFDRRVYISQKGKFFNYGRNSAGMISEQNQFVSEIDGATSVSRQRMGAWTIEGGNLTRITHHIEGFIVSTISIDPGKSTCTATVTMQPDPVTHRFVRQMLSGPGRVVEMISMTTDSSTCTIRKGNIFANDQ
jgi:hypothetical protein